MFAEVAHEVGAQARLGGWEVDDGATIVRGGRMTVGAGVVVVGAQAGVGASPSGDVDEAAFGLQAGPVGLGGDVGEECARLGGDSALEVSHQGDAPGGVVDVDGAAQGVVRGGEVADGVVERTEAVAAGASEAWARGSRLGRDTRLSFVRAWRLARGSGACEEGLAERLQRETKTITSCSSM